MRNLAVLLFGLVLWGCTSTGTAPEDDVWFVDQAEQRGLVWHHRSGFRDEYWLPEITAGGGAFVDVDNDGDLDIYLVQSGRIGEPQAEFVNELFINQGNGYFQRSIDAGAANHNGYGMGVATGDYDNDGDVDMYVTNLGANVLLNNAGNGVFDDVSAAARVADTGWGTAATFADFDRDGWLDLFVVNYLHWSPATFHDCYAANTLTYCQPAHDNAASDRVYQNNKDGTFTERTIDAGLRTAFGNGLGVVAEDFNQDGWIDVFVANDAMVNQMWINQKDFTFRDEAALRGVAMDDHGIAKAGMGVAAVDQDNDSDVDLLVVNIQFQTDSFFRNDGSYFTDATSAKALGHFSRRFTRFGVLLADFDNDSFLDLFEANGRVYHEAEHLGLADVFAEPNTLFRGTRDGKFAVSPLMGGTSETLVATSRAAVLGDVNGDGALDVLVVNKDANPHLLINHVKAAGQFVRIKVLNEHGSDYLGAVVSGRVGETRQYRTIQSAGSYLAANEPVAHFGLAEYTQIRDVEIKLVDGSVARFGSLASGMTHVLQMDAMAH